MKKQNEKSVKFATAGAFTVVEVVVSLIIIAMICSSVLLVMKQLMGALGESRLRMEAFEVARENMENLLISKSVEETADYGISEKNPNIEWETIVEPFSDVGDKMWVRAICSATYPDANGQPQTIELTHWLTDLPDSVKNQILSDQAQLEDMNEPNMPVETEDLFDEKTSDDKRQNTKPNNGQADDELKKFLDQLPRE